MDWCVGLSGCAIFSALHRYWMRHPAETDQRLCWCAPRWGWNRMALLSLHKHSQIIDSDLTCRNGRLFPFVCLFYFLSVVVQWYIRPCSDLWNSKKEMQYKLNARKVIYLVWSGQDLFLSVACFCNYFPVFREHNERTVWKRYIYSERGKPVYQHCLVSNLVLCVYRANCDHQSSRSSGRDCGWEHCAALPSSSWPHAGPQVYLVLQRAAHPLWKPLGVFWKSWWGKCNNLFRSSVSSVLDMTWSCLISTPYRGALEIELSCLNDLWTFRYSRLQNISEAPDSCVGQVTFPEIKNKYFHMSYILVTICMFPLEHSDCASYFTI